MSFRARPCRNDSHTPPDQALLGESLPVRKLRRAISKMAMADLPVLITGETGTGKELAARLLHAQSARAHGPFVAVNCPALPNELFQAELFGYERGAFTGAAERHAGRIDAAEGGVLFLDEIGDMPLSVQAVLLRFLEDGRYERLGRANTIQADVRVLAATHIDLGQAVAEGRFREDLFYRLKPLQLQTPPLRVRGTDKLLLAEHFIAQCTRQLGLRSHVISAAARTKLMDYHWPGNIRELRNCIQQAMVLCEHHELSARDLDLQIDNVEPGCAAETTLKACRKAAERDAIKNALEVCGGCVEAAAGYLDVSRAQLYRLIKSHEINQA
jgi:two-component system, NtrC family, response regulator HydG